LTAALATLEERVTQTGNAHEELEAARASVEERDREIETLKKAHGATQEALAAQLEESASREQDDGASEALQEALAAAKSHAAANESLAQDNERLGAKLARMREAVDAMETDRGADVLEEVRTLYDDINEIASAWRNDVSIASDYFEEIEEGFTDSEQRDAAHDALRELLASLSSASLDVKDRLKAFRGLLED